MIPHLAGGDDLAVYRRVLATGYERHITVHALDRAGRSLQPLTGAVQDGQVTVEAGKDVSRALDLTLLDPRRRFGFDSDTYTGGPLTMSRMIRVEVEVRHPLLSGAAVTPIFTGPVTSLERTGPLVRLEAQGLELFGLGEGHKTLQFQKGARKTHVIRTLLKERMGLEHVVVPQSKARLPRDLTVTRKDQAWRRAVQLAASMNRQLYLDGAGVARMRRRPGRPSWVFEGGSLLTEPTIRADLSETWNHVVIDGPTPKGKKNALIGRATAPRGHDLSPWRLGPGDKELWLTHRESNEHLSTQREADEYAADVLKDGLRLIHHVEVDTVPVWHLDPLDLVRVVGPYEDVSARARTFSLPIGLGGGMSLGYRGTYGLKGRGRGRKYDVAWGPTSDLAWGK